MALSSLLICYWSEVFAALASHEKDCCDRKNCTLVIVVKTELRNKVTYEAIHEEPCTSLKTSMKDVCSTPPGNSLPSPWHPMPLFTKDLEEPNLIFWNLYDPTMKSYFCEKLYHSFHCRHLSLQMYERNESYNKGISCKLERICKSYCRDKFELKLNLNEFVIKEKGWKICE